MKVYGLSEGIKCIGSASLSQKSISQNFELKEVFIIVYSKKMKFFQKFLMLSGLIAGFNSIQLHGENFAVFSKDSLL